MNREDFLNEVKENLKSYLDKEEKHYTINVRKVLKNNGIELEALTIAEAECKASPTIYLNRYYKEFEEGRTVESISREIYELFCANSGKLQLDAGQFADYSKMRHRIAFKVISANQNEKLLRDIPHILKLDLAIVFYCIIRCNQNENATTLIHNSHLDMWNVTPEELYREAVKNTPVLLPYEIKSMGDIIKEMLGESESGGLSVREDGSYGGQETEALTDMLMEELERSDEEANMFVLTNVFRFNGAAAMFYDGVLKQFAKRAGRDLIILPSSIHEVILLPAEDNMEPGQFKRMISEVNTEEVDPAEVLSDHAYMYLRDRDKIVM